MRYAVGRDRRCEQDTLILRARVWGGTGLLKAHAGDGLPCKELIARSNAELSVELPSTPVRLSAGHWATCWGCGVGLPFFWVAEQADCLLIRTCIFMSGEMSLPKSLCGQVLKTKTRVSMMFRGWGGGRGGGTLFLKYAQTCYQYS